MNQEREQAALFDAAYYQSHCGNDYRRNNGWEEFFGHQASCIKKQLGVHYVLDVGCAAGYLVESLRDLGVDAEGIDISDYALSCVREDIRPYCRKQSVLEPIGRKYDLVTCIEVLEHLWAEDIALAVEHLCGAADLVLFSSTPSDYDEETHFSVHTTDYWAEQFAYHGLYHDVRFDASFVSVQAMLFRRGDKSAIDLVRDYEPVLFQKNRENFALRHQLNILDQNARTDKENWQKQQKLLQEEAESGIRDLSEKVASLEAGKERLESAMAAKEEEYALKIAEKEDDLRRIYTMEVEKRRYYENKFRTNQKEHEELEFYRLLTTQMRQTINLKITPGTKAMSLRRFFLEKLRCRLESRRLLRAGMEHWELVFDPKYYAENNPDVYRVYGNDRDRLWKHFVCHGMVEARQGNETFNVYVYIESNPDVVEKLRDNIREYYIHYMTEGHKDGRRAI